MNRVPLLHGHDPLAIAACADALAAGELVAFPTETVYGLGADAGNDAGACLCVFAEGCLPLIDERA